jgi:hypothetical protein
METSEGNASKGDAGEGGGNGMLNEQGKTSNGESWQGGGNGMLNETEGKAIKGECWCGRREWNAEWDRRKDQQRRMLVWAERMECWMRQKERPSKENAGKGGGNGMLNETDENVCKGECWQGQTEWNAEWHIRKACKGECWWWGRRKWNAEWNRQKGKQRKKNAGEGGGNEMLNERGRKASK